MSTCSNADYPFSFLDTSGNGFVNGTLFEDSCIFPNANCNADNPTADCCVANNNVVPDNKSSHYMYLSFLFLYYPYMWAVRALRASRTPEAQAKFTKEKEDRIPIFVTGAPNGIKKILLILWGKGFTLFTVSLIVLGIMIGLSKQNEMSVTQRTSLQSAEAFMVPYIMIFSFVEDIVTVRVIYAMAHNDKAKTDRLIHLALASVIATGLLSGLIATLLGVFESTLTALTMPGLTNDRALYPGCSFIEDVDISIVLPYWIMLSWSCMGNQIAAVLSGFLMGAHEIQLLGWIFLIGQIALGGIWFGGINTSSNLLSLLGTATIASEWIPPLLCLGYLASPLRKGIGERTGFVLSAKKVFATLLMPFRKGSSTTSGEEDASNANHREETTSMITEGLKIMFVDVTIQLCITCSIYLSLNADGAVAYQITALQSFLPVYGAAYVLGPVYIIKLLGPKLLATMPDIFVGFVKRYVVVAFLLIVLVIGVTTPFLRAIAYDSGANACEYASSSQCLPFFEKVLGKDGQGGPYTLFMTYDVFAAASSVDVMMLLLRAILVACLDFDFMVVAAVVAGLSYVPAILVVQFAGLGIEQQAIGYFATMYIPQLVLVLMFLGRLAIIIPRISNGAPGPWSDQQVSSVQGQELAASAVAKAVPAEDEEQSL